MVPKHSEELRDGGSLYWVIRGEIMCRQRLLDVRPFVDKEGVGRCHLVLEPKLVLVEPRPWRAFQGWRYLAHNDAPRDLDRAAPGAKNMPEALLALGCVAGQGFLFAKASSLESLSKSPFVARRNALWNSQTRSEDLSPTGRFKALKPLPGGRTAGAA